MNYKHYIYTNRINYKYYRAAVLKLLLNPQWKTFRNCQNILQIVFRIPFFYKIFHVSVNKILILISYRFMYIKTYIFTIIFNTCYFFFQNVIFYFYLETPQTPDKDVADPRLGGGGHGSQFKNLCFRV